MKLTRYYPTNRLAQSADLDSWIYPSFSAFDALFGKAAAIAPATLAVDVYEDANSYFAQFEVPGVKKEDAKIELHEGKLTVSVTKARTQGDSEETLRLSRTLSVPESVPADGISAKLADGVLTVTLPKPEERKPRTIELS